MRFPNRSTERKGSLQDFHRHFEIEQVQKSEEQKREKQVLMTKNGELLHVRESWVDKFLEEGWQETQVLKSKERYAKWHCPVETRKTSLNIHHPE